MRAKEKAKQEFGLEENEYLALIIFGENPDFLIHADIFDNFNLKVISTIKTLLDRGFVEYSQNSKLLKLTEKGKHVWHLEDSHEIRHS